MAAAVHTEADDISSRWPETTETVVVVVAVVVVAGTDDDRHWNRERKLGGEE